MCSKYHLDYLKIVIWDTNFLYMDILVPLKWGITLETSLPGPTHK